MTATLHAFQTTALNGGPHRNDVHRACHLTLAPFSWKVLVMSKTTRDPPKASTECVSSDRSEHLEKIKHVGQRTPERLWSKLVELPNSWLHRVQPSILFCQLFVSDEQYISLVCSKLAAHDAVDARVIQRLGWYGQHHATETQTSSSRTSHASP